MLIFTCPTFPPLSQRGVCEAKHHYELFILFTSKHFGKYVCNLLICGTMLDPSNMQWGLPDEKSQLAFTPFGVGVLPKIRPDYYFY